MALPSAAVHQRAPLAGQEHAFWVLVQLMRRYRLRGLFLSSSPTLAVALFKVCCSQPPAPRVQYAGRPAPVAP
jgi:hypothetical protein